jgi:DNA invertase Pin-like site-specific DNA recombinase
VQRRAISYARFSTGEQADGDSARRQLALARAYCERNNLELDERTYADFGVSGWTGGNSAAGELAELIEAIEGGRVPKGVVLVVENMDRITRLPPDEATALIMRIVKAGVDVATLSPEQVYTKANIHRAEVWIPLQVACCLSAEESRKKSERVHAAWGQKRGKAGEKKLTKKGPAWLKITADRTDWMVLEDKAARVRQAFDLAREGLGVTRIAGVLNKECPQGLIGKKNKKTGRYIGWSPSYVNMLLRSPSVLGIYVPHVGTCAKRGSKSTRKPLDKAEWVKGYFPAVVEQGTFDAVQLALDKRRKGGGRTTGTPNVFNGILYDAADGERMVLNGNHGNKVLVSYGAARRKPGSEYRSVRYAEFECAVLAYLNELKPADLRPRRGQDPEAKVAALEAECDALRRRLKKLTDGLKAGGDFDTGLALLRDMEGELREAERRLDRARGEAATPTTTALDDAKSVIGLLEKAEGEELAALRSRLRRRLREVIEEAWWAGEDGGRIGLLQAHLRTGQVQYVIFARPRGRPFYCYGYRANKVGEEGMPDLRRVRSDAGERRRLATAHERARGLVASMAKAGKDRPSR